MADLIFSSMSAIPNRDLVSDPVEPLQSRSEIAAPLHKKTAGLHRRLLVKA
jgi:hypothetical protein